MAVCRNQYRIIFGNVEDAERFRAFIEQSAKEENSLISFFEKAGIGDKARKDIKERIISVKSRHNEKQGEVLIASESDLTPAPNTWDALAKYFEKNVTTYYEAEEFGFGICDSNDPCMIGKYIMDISDWHNQLPAWFPHEHGPYCREYVIRQLSVLLKMDCDDIDVLIGKLLRSKYRSILHVFEIEKEPMSDWLV